MLRRLTVPIVVVLHTVLTHPIPSRKSLLEQIVAATDAVVTITRTAHDRLLSGYAGATAIGPDLDQGAESTLALVTTLQRHTSPSPFGGRVAGYDKNE